MITIYGVYRSRAARTLWCAREAGVAFAHVPVVQAYRMAKGLDPAGAMTTDDPAFLAINPQGQIPAMTDGDLVLTESMAITLYLADGTPIGPRDGRERALMLMWALQAATGIEGDAVAMFQATMGGMTLAAAERLDVLARGLRRPLARLEAHLAGQDWMLGDRFTVADINTAECLRYVRAHPSLLTEFPVLSAWLDRAQARPAFREMWAAREAEAP
jgi:glutathione S-transferase